MFRKALGFVGVSLIVALGLSGCGGSSPAVNVSVTAGTSTVDGNDTTTLTATVTHDHNSAGVTWSINGGGTLSNTTTSSATFAAPAPTSSSQSVTITATSIADTTKTGTTTITIPAAPLLTSTNASLAGAVGSTYSVTLAASGGISPYTWALASGSLPPCLTLKSTGVITTTSGTAPTASCAGTYSNITFKVTDSGTPTPLTETSSALTITITAPSITFTPALPGGTVGTAYTGSVAATGPVGATTYSVASGALPPDLSLNTSTGAITGTPKAADVGTATFKITVVDAYGDTATSGNLSLTITAPTITFPPSLAGGTVGTAYSATTAATGAVGATTYSVSTGALPPDLSLNTITGAITGTPKAADVGTATFKITVVDAYGDTATSGSLSITIAAASAITFGSAPAATATFALAYSSSVTASGGAGSLTYSVSSGALPPDLTLASAGGITGTPKAADIGTFTFAVKATDAYGDSATSPNYSIVVSYPTLTITTGATLPAGYGGSAYSQSLAASGGSGTGYSWTVTAGGSQLTAVGLSLSGAGVLSGTTPVAGAASFSVKVTDSASNTATATFSVTINAALTITTASPLPVGYGGTAYSQTLLTSGGTGTGLSWTVTAGGSQLTAVGLSLSSAGVLSSSSPVAGGASFTVKVTDSASNTATGTFSVTINAGLAITTGATLPAGYAGVSYSQPFAASGGTGTGLTWSITSGASQLTALGLSLSSVGVLSGASPTAGTATFSAKVTDSASNTATGTFSVTINAALTITSPATLPNGYAGAAYSQTLATSGGSGTGSSWTVTAGSSQLTTIGLSLSSTGVLSGSAPTAGTASFSVKVTDSASNSATATLSVTIGTGLTITSGNPLPSGYGGTVYTDTLTSAGGSGSGLSWTVTSGASQLTAIGLSLSNSGVLSGSSPVAGSASFTVKVTDSASNAATATFSVTINAGLTISTASPLPVGYAGTAYTDTLATSGGSGTGLSWTVTAGNSQLTVIGLSLSSTGVLSGSSPTAGTATFTVKVTDSASNTATGTLSVTINAALKITSPATLPNGFAGAAYSQTLTTSGGSGTGLSWTVTSGSSQLTAIGLSLSSAGALSGSSPTAGGATFGVKVTDSASNSATATLTVTIGTGLTITSANPLPSGNAGTAYTDTLTSAGGSGSGLTWTVTAGASNLTAIGLSLSSGGVLSGSSLVAGSASFTVKVTDSASNTATASLNVSIYSALALPASNSLPSGYTGVAYTGSVSGSGGSGSLSVAVTSALSPSDGTLATNVSGATVNVTGTPSTAATVSFSIKLTDTTTGNSITQTYSIQITTPTPVNLPSPSSSVPGPATANQSYTGSINASGGVPPYTWSINGATVTSGGLTLGNGTLTAYSSGGSSLDISGTPSTTGTVTLTNVKVVDSLNTNSSNTYTITVNPAGGSISGQFFLQNNCNGGSLPVTFTVTITNTSTNATIQATTDTNGNYSFSGVPFGTYTIAPSVAGASSSLFYPANYSSVGLSTTNSSISGENFNAEVGYNVSGTVTYGGTQTGQVYLSLSSNNCGGGQGQPGTSITAATLSSGGAYTIHGVPPGSYTLNAWMDSTGITSGTGYPGAQGAPNSNDPTGSNSGVSITNANATALGVTLTNPAYATPPNNPSIQVIPSASGVLIFYNPPNVSSSSGQNEEAANEYTVEWAVANQTDSDGSYCALGGGTGGAQFGTVAGSHTFYAVGNGATVWILNNTVAGANTFTIGTVYCFQARAFNTLASTTHPSGWTTPTDGDGNAQGVTIGSALCSSGCTAVSGSVTIPVGVTIASGVPLYVGFYQQSPGSNGPSAIYATEITAPASGANNYSITIPSGSNYVLFGILDQNNDGEIDAADVTNVRNNNSSGITLSGSSMSGVDVTLPSTGATATVQTQYQSCGTNCSSYNLNLQVNEENKLPVAVTLSSGPNMLNPVDMGLCASCGNSGEYQYSASIPGGAPNAGDQYDFIVTYSDGTQDTGGTINGQVTGWNSGSTVVGPSDAPSNLQTSGSNTDEPNFSWTDSASSMGSNFSYSFYLQQNNCTSGNCNIWQIPGQNSSSNGFSSSITSLTWGMDPTGGNSLPTGSLSSSDTYSWTIQVQDSNGNQAQTSTGYTP
jgi:hypothetical protein